MRIVENTPSRVTLREQKVWIPLLLVMVGGLVILTGATHPSLATLFPAVVLALAGLAVLHSNSVVFDQGQDVCTITNFNLFRRRRRDVAFADIADLVIEPAPGRSGIAALSCRFSLAAGQEAIPLTAGYEPGPERYRAMRDAVLDLVFAGRPRPRSAQGDLPETLAVSGLTA